MKKLVIILLLIFPIIGSAGLKIGQCVRTTITTIEPRLKGNQFPGYVMSFRNGLGVTDYSIPMEVQNSDIDDVVKICRLAPPPDFYKECPKEYSKSVYMILYSVYNFRTKEQFIAGDRSHVC